MNTYLKRLAWLASYAVSLALLAGLFLDDFSDAAIFFMLVSAIIAFGIKSIFLPDSLLDSVEKKAVSEDSVSDVNDFKEPEQRYSEIEQKLSAMHVSREEKSNIVLNAAIADKREKIVTDEDGMAHVPAAPAPDKRTALLEEEIEEVKEKKEEELPQGPSPLAQFFHGFFKENALAKVGGILLFLAVLFLMQLVYDRIGPVGKLLLGFSFSFFLFAVGVVLERKSFVREARVLYGSTILINYLVILSGRYLIGADVAGGQLLLNESLTFGLLILNTVFAVVVSMANRSRIIMVFSVLMAFINPFLVGEEMSFSAYTIVAYAFAVGAGALAAAHYFRQRMPAASLFLLWTGFLGTNILALAAQHDDAYGWLAKLGLILFAALGSYLVAVRGPFASLAVFLISGSYVFTMFLVMGSAGLRGYIETDPFLLAVLLIFFAIIAALNVRDYLKGGFWANILIAFAPLLIILMMLEERIISTSFLPIIIPAFTIYYLAALAGPLRRSDGKWQQIGYAVLAIFLTVFATQTEAALQKTVEYAPAEAYGTIFAAFLFLAVSFFAARQSGMERLYAIASFASAIMLAIVFDWNGNLRDISALSLLAFLAAVLCYPIFAHRVLARPLALVGGMLPAAIFVAFGIYGFWDGASGLSRNSIGLSYALIAMAYFLVSVLAYSALRHMERGREVSADIRPSDSFYPLLAIAISFLSLSVAYIFSDTPSIITSFLLFEASVLYFFYARQNDGRIYVAAFILMMIGLNYLVNMDVNLPLSDPTMFIPLFIVLASFAWSIYSLRTLTSTLRYFHDVGHVIGIMTIGYFLADRVVGLESGEYMLLWALYLFLLTILYSAVYSGVVRWAYLGITALLYLWQFLLVGDLDARSRVGENLMMAQYFASILFFALPYIFHAISRRCQSYRVKDGLFPAFFGLSAVYAFAISTEYVYLFFDRTSFIITVYWGIIAMIMLFYGIFGQRIRFRSLGLYVLILTVAKIMLFDVWSDLDDAILRIVALMLVGTVMIVVSMLYSRRYGGDLKGEMAFANLMKSGKDEGH